ncbi:ribonucleoside hydrolase RihC [Bifidobacterium sp. ESL0764]|uniref:ribonucleoside hydrolase RihC n=1 Tax=Bifidobacterium sp. ESL0764 TaxID=2983228 RepID=UPI0023F6D507|nr:ribonucleoside hydrolase RihC [Bifidobacterium sp. ESL0764]WEV65683.1 ribonucleoside hydrolase RihC [Bifidobacterium sp. ESL0764]
MTAKPIIIDTDPGIDDALAISIALFAPEVDIKLITTVAGNVKLDYTTTNALRILTYLNKRIPVARGASEPLLRAFRDASDVHGKSGMEGFEFPEPDTSLLCERNAVDEMRHVLLASDEPITLVPIGPLTNIALLLKTYPEVKSHIAGIVMMGGSIDRGNQDVMSEFNINVDPTAAKIVFRSGVPITMVGLNIGLKAKLLAQDSAQLPTMGKVGKMAYGLFKHYRSGTMETGQPMFDPTAMACLLDPDLFTLVDTFVDVETCGELTTGCTVVDLDNVLGREPNAKVAVDIDAERFRSWLLDRVSKCD